MFHKCFCATLWSGDDAFVSTSDSLLIPFISKNFLWNVLHFFMAWPYNLHMPQSLYAFNIRLSLSRIIISLNSFHGIKSNCCRDFNITGIIIFFSVRERKWGFKEDRYLPLQMPHNISVREYGTKCHLCSCFFSLWRPLCFLKAEFL